jgi:hypothetical protein
MRDFVSPMPKHSESVVLIKLKVEGNHSPPGGDIHNVCGSHGNSTRTCLVDKMRSPKVAIRNQN